MPAKHAYSLQQTYAEVAAGYEEKHPELDAIEVKALDLIAPYLVHGGKILDLGAGTGVMAKQLIARGYEVVMFDLSEEMLEIAKKKVPEATVVQGDMTEMSFAEESFDGVIARASILHLTKEEGKRVAKDVYKILKNNGIFYASLKMGEGEEEVSDDKYGKPMKRFFSFYTQSEAEELLKIAGFKEIKSIINNSKSSQTWVQVWGKR